MGREGFGFNVSESRFAGVNQGQKTGGLKVGLVYVTARGDLRAIGWGFGVRVMAVLVL